MTPKSRKLILFGLISLLILLTITFGLYIPYLKAYNLVHPTRRPFERSPADVGISGYEDAQFVTSDGLTLKGWYIPPAPLASPHFPPNFAENGGNDGGVVIFVHGLGSDRAELLDEAGFIIAHGYGALLFDMRACGQSEGNVSTMGYEERRDIRAAIDFVRLKAGADAPLALLGHSMGASASLLAAAEMPEIRAVVAESPFTTLEDNISDGVLALTGLPPFPFAPLVVFFGQQQAGVDIRLVRPLDVIGQISPRAVLLIHGAKDSVIPVRNSYALYEAAGEPKQLYILPEVRHGGFLQAEPELFPKTILDFLAAYLK